MLLNQLYSNLFFQVAFNLILLKKIIKAKFQYNNII